MVVGIKNTFNQYFEMVPANSDELKNEVYKLRFSVFCTETGIFDAKLYSDGLESDEYDANSVHYLIRYRKSGVYAATTRLILPDLNNLQRPFPIELPGLIDYFQVLKDIPRTQIAEVSRFCVSKEFKRRKNEAGTVTGIGSETDSPVVANERRTYPHITLALIASLIKISDDQDIHYWYAAMEPAFLRFVSTLGIHFARIGPMCDYHGMRFPCVIKVSELLDGVAQKNIDIWKMLTGNEHAASS